MSASKSVAVITGAGDKSGTALDPAFVATATPARYISRLCKHFAHKLPVSFDEHQGRIEFAFGLALLQAEDAGLTLRTQASSAEEIGRAHV